MTLWSAILQCTPQYNCAAAPRCVMILRFNTAYETAYVFGHVRYMTDSSVTSASSRSRVYVPWSVRVVKVSRGTSGQGGS